MFRLLNYYKLKMSCYKNNNFHPGYINVLPSCRKKKFKHELLYDQDTFESNPCTNYDYISTIESFEFIQKKSEINSFNSKGLTECTPLSTPQNLKIFPFLPYSINLQWQGTQGVPYYKIYREIDYSGNYQELITVFYPNSSYSDNGLTVGIHYDYKIQAFRSDDCFSALSYSSGSWASWRHNNYFDILNQIYISDRCWNWCCGWPEGDIELKYRIIKYNKSDQQVEFPKNALASMSKKLQKGKWCTYDKELFRWDITTYAYNYLLFIYEDDGGDDKGTTIKLSAGFKPTDKVNIGAEISFTIDDTDENLGWIEIYHFDQPGKEYLLSPRKGTAMLKIRQ